MSDHHPLVQADNPKPLQPQSKSPGDDLGPYILQTFVKILPPTENSIYVKTKRGIFLSDEARKYIRQVVTDILNLTGPTFQAEQDIPYELSITFAFPLENICNIGWPKKATTLIKQMDTSNRIKVLEDAIKKAIGLDDRHFFRVNTEKMVVDNGKEGILIQVRKISERSVGLDLAKERLQCDRTTIPSMEGSRPSRKKRPEPTTATGDIFNGERPGR